MSALSRASDSVGEQRNERGQWVAGVSGNRHGRPGKKAVVPKGLTEHLADAMMMEKIPLTNDKGKQEMVPVFEAVPRQLVRSLPGLNAKDLISALRWMHNLQVFDEMRKRAGNWPEGLSREQLEERVMARLAQLREQQGQGQ